MPENSPFPIFISWSGSFGKRAAEAIKDWAEMILPNVEAFVSSEDILPGSNWQQAIDKGLGEAGFGIVCADNEALDSRWVNFECGALSRMVGETRICCVKFGVSDSDLSGPLSVYHAVEGNESGFRQLQNSINTSIGERGYDFEKSDRLFEKFWPELSDKIEPVEKDKLKSKRYNTQEVGILVEELFSEVVQIRSQISKIDKNLSDTRNINRASKELSPLAMALLNSQKNEEEKRKDILYKSLASMFVHDGKIEEKENWPTLAKKIWEENNKPDENE